MKVSENWLKTWVNPEVSREEMLQRLTLAGLELESVQPVAPVFSGVVVSEIIACQPHPDADTLTITQVSTGDEQVQVVTNAPNARAGLRVPLAGIGAILPDDFHIKPVKLRGVESSGMFCGEDTLGLESDDDGSLMELPADAPLGKDIRDYLDLDDVMIDISLTPDRADCLSLAGLTREISANYPGTPVSAPMLRAASVGSDAVLPITVEAAEICPRYAGRIIENVDVSRQAPLWMKQRLFRSGMRSIDPIVDITNYVMLELGQPMHGFDLEQLKGGINVRLSKTGEKITLLDGSEHILQPGTLLITDSEKPLAIAGIMGGEKSGIDKNTRHIFLESLFLRPEAMMGKARSYGLHTESSHRFERGVDYELQNKALERATELVLQICGGKPGPVTEVTATEHLPENIQLTLRQHKISALLGLEVKNRDVETILHSLGIKVSTLTAETWLIDVPSWRFDITVEADLIEEIGRINGYDKLPVSSPILPMRQVRISEKNINIKDIKKTLVNRGYHETINYSLVDPELSALFEPEKPPVLLQNAIASDMSAMRTSLLPGLVKSLTYNQRRQQNRIRLFEEGLNFIQQNNEILQTPWLGAVICGHRFPESWLSNNEPCDFYDIKADLETLLTMGGKQSEFIFERGYVHAMHPGQSALIKSREGVTVGHIGAIHPGILAKLDIRGPVYAFEIRYDAILESIITTYMLLSKYPEIRRDIAIIVDSSIASIEVTRILYEKGGQWLKNVCLFDVYCGESIGQGKKSFAVGLTWQHQSRTLKDDEVNQCVNNLIQTLETEMKATLRK